MENMDDIMNRTPDQPEQQLRDFPDIIDVETSLDRDTQINKKLLDAEDTR